MIIKIYSRRKELLKEQELLLRTLGLRILRPIHEAEQVQFLLGHVNFELLRCQFEENEEKYQKVSLARTWPRLVKGGIFGD